MKFLRLLPILLAVLITPVASTNAQTSVSVAVAPPALRYEEQPLCPVDGYLWSPGYWAWDNGYYWVPGVWVPPPQVGYLWTPGYWAFLNGVYLFNTGYWGPRVGYYGGINYGYGYGGNGYYGGRWAGNRFQYNTAVTRVNRTVIHNTYVNRNVVTTTRSRTSFNGPGGVTAKPTSAQLAAARGAHVNQTSQQVARRETAAQNKSYRAPGSLGHATANATHPAKVKQERPANVSRTNTVPTNKKQPVASTTHHAPVTHAKATPQHHVAPRQPVAHAKAPTRHAAPHQQAAHAKAPAHAPKSPQARATKTAPQKAAPKVAGKPEPKREG